MLVLFTYSPSTRYRKTNINRWVIHPWCDSRIVCIECLSIAPFVSRWGPTACLVNILFILGLSIVFIELIEYYCFYYLKKNYCSVVIDLAYLHVWTRKSPPTIYTATALPLV